MQWRNKLAGVEWQPIFMDAPTRTLQYSVHAYYPYRAATEHDKLRVLVGTCVHTVVAKDTKMREPVPEDISDLKNMWAIALAGKCHVSTSAQCVACAGVDDNLRTCAMCLQTAHDACVSKVSSAKPQIQPPLILRL